ncbi:HEPN domain-containing protein [Vibrio sp. Vb1018]|uniref:HEPN domain-containing protein n=1 Tax=Vibrio sp. Vb1018 TaxID=3074636 RepID=UPI0023ECB80F|nr:HEPN domain-containing protein [Vibrio sp. Vb1018]MDF4656033.1 HEPN domain-containing protein [Vibrio parahaemolyticus]MDW1820189.1 HEPN domain-containing protein [Vibrio sp. Vb1018]
MLTFNTLKERHRRERNSYSQSLSTRVHRSLSWLKKAEACEDDDSTFTFLWIAFNSAYAQDFEQKANYGERGLYQEFLSRLVELDSEKLLSEIVWQNYSGAIRATLDNEFILESYWQYHSGRISETDWKEARSKAKIAANSALGHSNTASVLSIVFSRLYTLRNQIIHGGATFGSSVNRQQLRDCTTLLEQIIPVIITIMMDSSKELWGDPVYPLIKD